MSRISQTPITPRAVLTRSFETAPRPVVGFAHDYPDGWFTGLHAHPRAQLLYATIGVMRIRAEHASYIIPPGTGLVLPAAIPHSVRMDGCVAMRALFLRDDAVHPSQDRVAITAIAVSSLLRELILAACDEPIAWNLRGRGRHLAALVIDEIARARALPLSLPVPADPRVQRVTDALLASPADPRDLLAYAAHAGASPRTLARLFQTETGMGFQQWRRQLRLTEAMAVLAAGGSVSQAASAAGYASGPAFGAAFRTAFGKTPGAIRKHEPVSPRRVELRQSKGRTTCPNPRK